MTPTLREAAEQALEALEVLTDDYDDNVVGLEIDAITALRAALAEPQGEPVKLSAEDAWIARKRETFPADYAPERFALWAEAERHEFMRGWNARDLQGTAPQPAKREPLTDEEIIEIADKTQTAEPGTDGYILPYSFARAIEEAVWKKNS